MTTLQVTRQSEGEVIVNVNVNVNATVDCVYSTSRVHASTS